MTVLPDVQLSLRPGIVEFGWGHPAYDLLPVARLAAATELALAEAGAAALSYGAEQGPGRLLEQIAAWLARSKASGAAGEIPLDHLMVTGGVSQALDMLCTLFTRPGDPILVQAPTYHLALRIFRDHGLELLPVPADDEGLLPDALSDLVRRLAEQGKRPAFLYLVSTFANPTGLTLPAERRQAIVSVAQAEELRVLEDDVYYDLCYNSAPPPPMFAMAPPGPVIRLGSFSKVLAPGLRLGWLTASPDVVRRCAGSGMPDSGGGLSHFTAHVVSAFIAQGWLDEHVQMLQRSYRDRRDALLASLARHLPGTCSWTSPGGGFFVWLRLPAGMDSTRLQPTAEAVGVSYLPGRRFYPTAGSGGEQYCRLAFSLLSPAEMEEGAMRLGDLLRRAPGEGEPL